MSRWKFSCEARCPNQPTGETWQIGILDAKFRVIVVSGHKQKHARLLLAAEVVQDPIRIYGGWSRPGKEKCFVYVGKPTKDLRDFSIVTPAPPGMLFLVFVTDDGSMDDWGWREASSEDVHTPQGVSGALLWPL